MSQVLGFRELGRMAYEPVWHAMQRFTNERGTDRPPTKSGWWNTRRYSPRARPARQSTYCFRVIFRWCRSTEVAK